jgi:hypothetical protein
MWLPSQSWPWSCLTLEYYPEVATFIVITITMTVFVV